MVKKETHQENWDSGKLWTAIRVLPCRNKDDPQWESDTGERTRTSETSQRQQCTENSERTNVQDETLDRPRMQQWHSGPRLKTEATKQQADKGPRRQTAAMSERTSSWTYRNPIDSVKIAKQKARSYAMLRKIKDWTLWTG
jgi:hypothetical protein